MSWKKMILGEQMPDKHDPRYQQQYEKEVAAGRKTARFLRIDRAAAWLQRVACRHPRRLFAILWVTLCTLTMLNVQRVVTVCSLQRDSGATTATEQQEQALKLKTTTHNDELQKSDSIPGH
jgi:hypothetical protein